MPNPGDKVYYMRYALTEGIRVCELRAVRSWDDGTEYWDIKPSCYAGHPGKDVFATWAEAVAAADSMRKRKLASMEKQAKKLRDMAWLEPSK